MSDFSLGVVILEELRGLGVGSVVLLLVLLLLVVLLLLLFVEERSKPAKIIRLSCK